MLIIMFAQIHVCYLVNCATQIQLLHPISKGHPANIRGHREPIAITKGLECELDKRFLTREGVTHKLGYGILGEKKVGDMGDTG